jgi:intracellular multiplication protein IcmK
MLEKTIKTLLITGFLCSVSLPTFADNGAPDANMPVPADAGAGAAASNTNDQTSDTTANTDAQSSAGLNTAAFQQMLNNYFPLTPDQIHQFKNVTAQQQQANVQPPGNAPPEGTSAIIPVTLKPGGIMPIIRIGAGMITSLVFIDASGQVWPITSYSIGDSASFNVQWDKKSGVLMIQGQKLYAQTNVGVMLQGLDIPVMLNLDIGQKKWDYLDYIQLDQNQPGDNNSPLPVAQAPGFLTDLLNGIPPQGATQMNVSDSAVAQIWSYQNQYIMVTKATLLSPAYSSKADGPGSQPLHAYIFPQAPEVLISNFGTIEKLIVSTGASNAS